MRIFRSIAALIAGYLVIVLITSFAFDLVLGHAFVRKGDAREMALGTLIAIVAGLLGGWVATLVGVLRPLVNASLAAIPVTIESTALLLLRTPRDELLFSAMGALVLIASTVAAGALRELVQRRHRATTS